MFILKSIGLFSVILYVFNKAIVVPTESTEASLIVVVDVDCSSNVFQANIVSERLGFKVRKILIVNDDEKKYYMSLGSSVWAALAWPLKLKPSTGPQPVFTWPLHPLSGYTSLTLTNGLWCRSLRPDRRRTESSSGERASQLNL